MPGSFGRDGAVAVARLAAVAGLAAAAACVLLKKPERALSFGAETEEEELERLLPVLQELLRSLFHECTDIAATTRKVHEKIESSNPAMADKLRNMWRTQVLERLEASQSDLASQLECATAELVELQRAHGSDAQVAAFASGSSAMVEDALQGLLPVLPSARHAEHLSQDVVISILSESYKLEEKKVKKAMHRARGKQIQLNVKEFQAISATAKKDALSASLKSALQAVSEEDGVVEAYMSALAAFMRDDAFAARRRAVDKSLAPKWDKILKPVSRSKAGVGKGQRAPPGAEGAVEEVFLGDALEQATGPLGA